MGLNVTRVSKANKGHDLRTWEVEGMSPITFIDACYDMSNPDSQEMYEKIKQAPHSEHPWDVFCWQTDPACGPGGSPGKQVCGESNALLRRHRHRERALMNACSLDFCKQYCDILLLH